MDKKKNLALHLLALIFIIIFLYSLGKIILWLKDNKQIDEETNTINEVVEVKEIEDDENTVIVETETKEDDLYFKYINYNLIDVDFSQLKKENNDTVAWIQVKGTNINYPVVQTNNNDYYLVHSFYKKANLGGWIFLDYRNDINNLSYNTIIYGHGRIDNSMFGTLKKVITSEWLSNNDNYVVRLSSLKENSLWQVFSVYKIPTTNDYIKTQFTNNQYLDFLNLIESRSIYDFNTIVNENDKILTLSTCYNDNEKIVLHAKLIKKEIK